MTANMTSTMMATGGPKPGKRQPGKRMFKEITGRHVLFLMLGFFGVIIATDAFLVYKAVSTFGGIETQDAYRKGVTYNERIAEERAQEARGWTKDARLEKGELRVTVRDKDQKGVEGLQISAMFGRPATNTEDRTLTLTPVGPGEYMATLGDIEPGNWVATMEARESLTGTGAVVYQSKVRLWKAP
ncbi:MAG: hypothetical protein C0519_04240 [Hyphomicrobium sp.]|jgi:nitrogen fixation protein FixH|nr:hypothetical protein [Hyphomicrobium sp.]PPD07731.1 MAG: hypothetical protein CTY28_07760 [Hyphomicrobium sp.]